MACKNQHKPYQNQPFPKDNEVNEAREKRRNLSDAQTKYKSDVDKYKKTFDTYQTSYSETFKKYLEIEESQRTTCDKFTAFEAKRKSYNFDVQSYNDERELLEKEQTSTAKQDQQ